MANLDLWDSYIVAPIKITERGESVTYHCLVDSKGEVLSNVEVVEILDKIRTFYKLEGIDEIVRVEKLKSSFYFHSRMHGNSNFLQDEKGKYLLPKTIYKYKPFSERKSEKPWSCRCGWCNTKVSSEVDEGYFSLHNEKFELQMERACSVACAELIWKESATKWVHKNKFEELFNLQGELK